jgi:hypothetical protein
MLHDCWFCKFNRGLLVVGMLLMAFICLVGSLSNLFQGHWRAASLEFICTFIPLGMIWIGLKVLRAIPILFDKMWPDDENQ